MHHRDRILATLHGQPCDQIPWSPRMDLWRLALEARGTMPARFVGRDLLGIAQELGCACHVAQGADATHGGGHDQTLRGLGLDGHDDYPFRVELVGLPVRFQRDDENLRTWIETPQGTIHTHLHQDCDMLRRGVSLPFVQSYALGSPDDLEALATVFDHLRVAPTPHNYATFRAHIGEQGVAVARGPVAASPLHLMLHELMPMDRFFYAYHDMAARLHELACHMEPLFAAMLDALCACDAEVVMWGANFDRDLTAPRFFEREMAPWLRRASERLHAAGKLMLCHTDGESSGLFALYRQCGFDVAESVCPAPMTERTLAEIREALGPDIAVWGGIPSVALLDEAMDDAAFFAYINTLFSQLGTGERLVLGVADNVPPDANLERLAYLGQRIAAWGPVRPATAHAVAQ
jgi:hypothetical protein